MQEQEWEDPPIVRFNAYMMLVSIALMLVLLGMAAIWLLDPSPASSQNAPPSIVWAIGSLYLLAIPVVVWKLLHTATSIRLGDDLLDVVIGFFVRKTIPRSDITLVYNHRPSPGGPDCRIVYAGGYFDVFLPSDERREPLAKRLMELPPPSSA